MTAAYRITAPALRIADAAGPLSEAELSRIWAAQSFPPEALTLADGRRLRIVVPGRPGGGSGPDYRDAIVAIDGVEQRGDLELHVRASSFTDHGHQRDAAYDNLILHVVYEADDGVLTRLHNGESVAVAEFAPWVSGRSQELQNWLAAPPLWLEPCSDAGSRLGPDGVLNRLTEEGRGRFALKTERLREAAAALGEGQALWQALLDVLGYGKDRAAWRRLAELLPVSLLQTLTAGLPPDEAADRVQAALMTTAGLATPPLDLAPLLPRAARGPPRRRLPPRRPPRAPPARPRRGLAARRRRPPRLRPPRRRRRRHPQRPDNRLDRSGPPRRSRPPRPRPRPRAAVQRRPALHRPR